MTAGLRVLVLQGPNLNLLGRRQPDVYGHDTLDEVERALDGLASELGTVLEHFQSNLEGDLVQRVQQAADEGVDGLLVNAGGFSHTSVSLRDAFLATALPFVEIHISNLATRESFRRESVLTDLALGQVMGFGTPGYLLALRGLVQGLRARV